MKLRAIIRRIHKYVTGGTCYECACGVEVKCSEDLDDGLCWTCSLRDMRGDNEHGLSS